MNDTRLLAVSSKCPAAMHQRDSWSIHDFAIVKEIGNGAVSCVYYALCKRSCLRVAIKVYNKLKLTKLNARQVEREIAIHSSMAHPHVVDFYAAFEDAGYIYLVLEYAEGGDLFDAVKRKGGRMPESAVVQQVLYPYLLALLYMHKRGIIHRDIKPENTVFTRENILKVTDFGLAINTAEERAVTRLGTLDYMAPEVLRCPDKYHPGDNKERVDLAYSEAVDAWAMGVLAYELIVGRPPFGMADREGTMRAITLMQPSIPDWVSEGAASFIVAALDKDASKRAPMARLIQHPWILMCTMKSGDTLLQQAPHLHSHQRTGSGQLPAFPSTPITLPQHMQSSHPRQVQQQTCSLETLLAMQQQRMQQQQQHGTMADALRPMSSGGGSAKEVASMPAALRFAHSGQQQQQQQQAPVPVQLAAVHNDSRPTKRVQQRSALSCLSDGSGGHARGGLQMAKPKGAAAAQTAAQAYWCTYGPGWTGMPGASDSGTTNMSRGITDAAPGASMSPFGNMPSGTGSGSSTSPFTSMPSGPRSGASFSPFAASPSGAHWSPFGAMPPAAASGASLSFGARPELSVSSAAGTFHPSRTTQDIVMTSAQGYSSESVEQVQMRQSLSFKRRMPDKEASLGLTLDLAGVIPGPTAGNHGAPLSPRGSSQLSHPDSPTRVRVQPVRSSSLQPVLNLGGPASSPFSTAGCGSHQGMLHQHQPSRFSKAKREANESSETDHWLSGPLQLGRSQCELQHSYSMPADYILPSSGPATSAPSENLNGHWPAAATAKLQQHGQQQTILNLSQLAQLGQATASFNPLSDPMMTDWRSAQNLPSLNLQSHPLSSPMNSGCNSPKYHMAGSGVGGISQSFSRTDSGQPSISMAMAAAGGAFQAALDALQVQNLTLGSPKQGVSAGLVSAGAHVGSSSNDSSGSLGSRNACSAAAAACSTATGNASPDPNLTAMGQDPMQTMSAARGHMSQPNALTEQQQQMENQRVQRQQILVAGSYRSRPRSMEGVKHAAQVDNRSGWLLADGPTSTVNNSRSLQSPFSSNVPSGSSAAAAAATLACGKATSVQLPSSPQMIVLDVGGPCSGLNRSGSSSLVSPSEPRVSWMLPSQSTQAGNLHGRAINTSCDSCSTGLGAPLILSAASPLHEPGFERDAGRAGRMDVAAAMLGVFNPMDLELLLPLLDDAGGEVSPSSRDLNAVVDFMNSDDELHGAEGLP